MRGCDEGEAADDLSGRSVSPLPVSERPTIWHGRERARARAPEKVRVAMLRRVEPQTAASRPRPRLRLGGRSAAHAIARLISSALQLFGALGRSRRAAVLHKLFDGVQFLFMRLYVPIFVEV